MRARPGFRAFRRSARNRNQEMGLQSNSRSELWAPGVRKESFSPYMRAVAPAVWCCPWSPSPTGA